MQDGPWDYVCRAGSALINGILYDLQAPVLLHLLDLN